MSHLCDWLFRKNEMSKKSLISTSLCTVLAACVLSLSACNTLEPSAQASGAQAFGHLNGSTEEYADLVDKSTDEGRFNAMILLARAQVSKGEFDEARKTAAALRKSAQNPVEQTYATIIDGLILSLSGQGAKASELLSRVNAFVINESAARYYHLLNFNTNEKLYVKSKQIKYFNAAFTSARELVALTSGDDRITVCRRTVNLLESADAATLSSKLDNARSDDERAYYEYALADASASPDAKKQLLAQFKNKYPSHPLNDLISDEAVAQQPPVSNAQGSETAAAGNVSLTAQSVSDRDDGEITPVNVKGIINIPSDAKIAVLLPLSGRYAKAVGEPAKLGVLSALSNTKSSYKVSFHDTAKENIDSILATLKKDGTALIIGPLLKPDVQALNVASPEIPVIALNKPDGKRPENEWYFDLGPDYEGALAAAKIKADGYKAPVVIHSGERNSMRAYNSFVASFGSKVFDCIISDPLKADRDVKKCNLQGKDAAYIAGSAPEAVSAKAAIPSEIKVYLTDQSFEGFNNSGQQLALNGALLGEMPWLLSDSELKDSLMKTVPKANSTAQRVFSAGYDAVLLAKNMSELAQNDKDVLHGLTGDIKLGDQGLIETAPMWVELGTVRN